MRKLLEDRRRRGDDGFTLIELLMVIIILGILAAIVVFSVRGINDKAAENACKAEVSTVETAYESYVAQNGGTPTLAVLVSSGFLRSTPTYVTAVDATSTTPLASAC